MPGSQPTFTLYLRLVSAAGIAVLRRAGDRRHRLLGSGDAEFWVLAALVLLGELFPIQVHGQVGEETFSTPFAFAMLLAYGIPEVVAVQVVASLAADLVRRRPVDRIVFNLAQLAISWVAAGLALELAGGTGLGDGERPPAADLPAIALAAAVFFAANSTLPRTAEALLQKASIAEHLTRRSRLP